MQIRLTMVPSTALLAGALAISAVSPPEAHTAPPTPHMPKVGDVAPDFKLQYVEGNDEKEVSLSQYRGKKNVVLAFYIFAFTGG